YLVALTPILFFFTDGVQDYTIFALAGCSAVYLFQSLKKGYRQFLLAMAVFLVMSVSYVSLSLVSDLTIKGRDFLEMAISSVVMVFVYPLVYLFERIFSLVSSTRLDDLCDTNQPVLKELQTLASGTFQHSMQVMNLSADIAQTIGADVSLVRAGALYHDIGKMVNPQCFIENAPSSGSTYHDQMTCKQSSAAIVRHVTDGLALAKKYRLPSIVADFISTHHGTSTTGYFFTKYVNEGGDPADISSFSYPGPRPKTKEQVIVHICDSIEAASRTLKSYSSESISEFVDGIVHHKLQEGQFDEAQISIEELMMIKARLKKYLEDFYHGRIVYPKSRIQIKQTKK
ncbi:MAG: HDIG domain-containing protein, partial [Bacteroidales bacterium]|nr:HDIG domain-containing protein [Bacteroidales bacterium]